MKGDSMAKTPSSGIDQNEGGKFIDRYWGRVPKFLHRIPEANICEVNQDYIDLINYILEGGDRDNISDELYREILEFIDKMCNPCFMNDEDKALMRAYDGLPACPEPSIYMNCDDVICCNDIVSCAEPEECYIEPDCDPAGLSKYSINIGCMEVHFNSPSDPRFVSCSNAGVNNVYPNPNLTLLDGPDLGISQLRGYTYLPGLMNDDAGVRAGSPYYGIYSASFVNDCDGMTAVELFDSTKGEIAVLNENVWAKGASLSIPNADAGSTWFEQNVGTIQTIYVRRVGCDQCNIPLACTQVASFEQYNAGEENGVELATITGLQSDGISITSLEIEYGGLIMIHGDGTKRWEDPEAIHQSDYADLKLRDSEDGDSLSSLTVHYDEGTGEYTNNGDVSHFKNQVESLISQGKSAKLCLGLAAA